MCAVPSHSGLSRRSRIECAVILHIQGLAVHIYILVHAPPLYVPVCCAVEDPDGDTVRCRWAMSRECGCVCRVFPSATLVKVGADMHMSPSDELLKAAVG